MGFSLTIRCHLFFHPRADERYGVDRIISLISHAHDGVLYLFEPVRSKYCIILFLASINLVVRYLTMGPLCIILLNNESVDASGTEVLQGMILIKFQIIPKVLQ